MSSFFSSFKTHCSTKHLHPRGNSYGHPSPYQWCLSSSGRASWPPFSVRQLSSRPRFSVLSISGETTTAKTKPLWRRVFLVTIRPTLRATLLISREPPAPRRAPARTSESHGTHHHDINSRGEEKRKGEEQHCDAETLTMASSHHYPSRNVLTNQEKKAYIDAELCLINSPPRSGTPGARNRFEELQYLHIIQMPYIHFVVCTYLMLASLANFQITCGTQLTVNQKKIQKKIQKKGRLSAVAQILRESARAIPARRMWLRGRPTVRTLSFYPRVYSH